MKALFALIATLVCATAFGQGYISSSGGSTIPLGGAGTSNLATPNGIKALVPGVNVTFNVTPSSITINATGGGGGSGPDPYIHVIQPADLVLKGFTLAYTPAVPGRVLFYPQAGIPQLFGIDYTVGAPNAANFLSWASLGLDGVLLAGDKILIVYN